MEQLSRRSALALGAAAVAAAAIPTIPFSPASAAPAMPAWIVGTPGEFDWEFVRASAESAARRKWVISRHAIDECEAEGDPECDCEFCSTVNSVDAERFKAWDDKQGEPNPGDWLRAGYGHICDRCGSETHPECGYAVLDKAVCEDCMTLEDWDIVDPERAAEKRADMADEEAL